MSIYNSHHLPNQPLCSLKNRYSAEDCSALVFLYLFLNSLKNTCKKFVFVKDDCLQINENELSAEEGFFQIFQLQCITNTFWNTPWNFLLHLPGNVLGNSCSEFMEQSKDRREVSSFQFYQNFSTYQNYLFPNIFSWSFGRFLQTATSCNTT